MQFLVSINQVKAVEWGLNAQQAMLFAFLHQVPTWARARQIDGCTYFNISKGKIIEELPLLTDKQDTAYRMMKQLAKLGLIEMTSCDNRTYMRLTEKGLTWNRTEGSEKNPTPFKEGDSQGSEKNPTSEYSPYQVGKISEPGSEKSPTSEYSPYQVGKISEPGSEKSPTNQVTNDPTPTHSGADVFARAAQQDDDGQPLTAGAHQFAMTLDWQPDSAMFAAQCQRAGLATDTGYAPHQLAKFTAHHADQPNRRHGEAAWISKFVDWVRNDQRQQAKQPASTGGANHANRHSHAGQRQRFSSLSPADARRLAQQQGSGQPGGASGQVFDGEYEAGHSGRG